MRQPSTYYVWDDPESKIQFLEETLHGKDWKVTVVYPDHDEASLKKREATKAELSSRGFIFHEGEDDCGHATLELHHLGEGTKPTDLVKEIGLVKGTMHMGSHPLLPLRYLLESGRQAIGWVEKVLHDPARANGFINLLAEGFLFGAGFDKSHQNIHYTHQSRGHSRALQRLSAACFFTQSFVYLFLAKSNEQVALDQLKHKLQHTQDHGGNITDIHYDEKHDKPETGIGHAITGFLRRYPVQIGALFNDLGMFAYMGHAMAEKKWKSDFLDQHGSNLDRHSEIEQAEKYVNGGFKSGFGRDILGGAISIIAWPLLILPRKETDEKTRKEHEGKPLAQAWDKFRANPEVAAGILTLGASSSRLLGAGAKGNTLQKIGETTYIGGDIALMMTKNDAYGSDNVKQVEKLAGEIAEHIRHMPVVLGPEAQRQFVQNTATFLMQKTLAETAGELEKKRHMTRAELDERSARLTQAVLLKLQPAENMYLQQVADAINHLADRFPDTKRAQVVDSLTKAVGGLSWVHATPEELKAALTSSVKPANAVRRTQLVQMKDISKEVAELAFVIPGLDAGGTAAAVHDALLPFIRSQQSDKDHLGRAMDGKAMAQLGMEPHMMSAAARSQLSPSGDLNR